jgi:hypothetical protein
VVRNEPYRGETVRATLSLEMLGYYRDEPHTQKYPPPLGLLHPDRGNFVAFVGDLGARALRPARCTGSRARRTA